MATAIQVAEQTHTDWFSRFLARFQEPSGWSRQKERIRFFAQRQQSIGRDAFLAQWPYPVQRMAAEVWDNLYPEVVCG